MKAQLILEDGRLFEGHAFGYLRESIGEVVFNTSMTGYQEIITDPSNYGNIVVMTYPLIGNYGINLDDMESNGPKIRGLIVREKANFPNNWRCEMDLNGYMKQNKIIGLEGIDTRALTKHIRNNGTMKGIISLRELTISQIQHKFDTYHNKTAVSQVTTNKTYEISGSGMKVALIDLGTSRGIIKSLQAKDCNIVVFSANTGIEEIMSANPDGILLSSGPGDPRDILQVADTVKKLMGFKPILGIGLGHQLLALTLGGDTERLKFGHRGSSHPVKDLMSNKVMTTSQNHGYVVKDCLPEEVIITHRNINDGTVEGFKHKMLPIRGVQFYPEENSHIYDEFLIITGGLEYAKG